MIVPAGLQAIFNTFANVHRIWANDVFEIQTLSGSGEDVAVFGSLTYRWGIQGAAVRQLVFIPV